MSQERDALISAALSYQASRLDVDHHPENPYGDAEMELKQEILDEAVIKYFTTLELT